MRNRERKLLQTLIVGKPNVGKSTLVNFLVDKKVSIVSRKAQTTQKNTTGVITKDGKQMVFFDTPGINKTGKNVRISETFKVVAEKVDVLIYVVDNRQKSQSIEHHFCHWLIENQKSFRKKVLVVNKIDRIDKLKLFEITKEINDIFQFDETFLISLKERSGSEKLKHWIEKQATFNNWIFEENYKTNLSKKEFLSELTREKVFDYIHEEIPYNLEIKTDYIESAGQNSSKVFQTVWINKKSYKPIILGKEGKSIKTISMLARKEMELFLSKKIHLFIRLKIKKFG